MSSTGGLNPRRYMVADSPGARDVCAMCQINAAKPLRHQPQQVTWADSWDDVLEPANLFRGI
jgi:hypothetical protein